MFFGVAIVLVALRPVVPRAAAQSFRHRFSSAEPSSSQRDERHPAITLCVMRLLA